MAGKKDDLHDETSRWIFDDDETGTDRATEDAGFTSHLDGPPDMTPPPFGGGSSASTVVIGGGSDGTVIGGLTGLGEDEDNVADDPVVGWLVVVKGKGIGHSIPLGPGINSVGRDSSERAPIPFGDTRISSKDHVKIVYDNQARGFLIAPGSGKNPTRLELAPTEKGPRSTIVMVAQPLESYAVIQLSEKTSVRFVAFCNEGFDWSDVIDEDEAS